MGIIGTAVGAATRGPAPGRGADVHRLHRRLPRSMLNQAAKFRYMFGGKVSVPMVVRTVTGAGMAAGAQHSQSLYAITPPASRVCKTVIPATPNDAKGLLLPAIRDNDPRDLLRAQEPSCSPRGEVPEGDYEVPIGKARLAREGHDVSPIGIGRHRAWASRRRRCSRGGHLAEVLDLGSLAPLDEDDPHHARQDGARGWPTRRRPPRIATMAAPARAGLRRPDRAGQASPRPRARAGQQGARGRAASPAKITAAREQPAAGAPGSAGSEHERVAERTAAGGLAERRALHGRGDAATEARVRRGRPRSRWRCCRRGSPSPRP